MARILVANDDQDLLELCRAILEEAEHVVTIVADGHEAINLARAWRPELIVVDWVMPHVNGPTAIATLRADAVTRRIPILLMSGSNGGDGTAREVGADSFLEKPFRPEELVAAVADLLERAQANCEWARKESDLQQSD
jgi:CheY-like chemotaxis protein